MKLWSAKPSICGQIVTCILPSPYPSLEITQEHNPSHTCRTSTSLSSSWHLNCARSRLHSSSLNLYIASNLLAIAWGRANQKQKRWAMISWELTGRRNVLGDTGRQERTVAARKSVAGQHRLCSCSVFVAWKTAFRPELALHLRVYCCLSLADQTAECQTLDDNYCPVAK